MVQTGDTLLLLQVELHQRPQVYFLSHRPETFPDVTYGDDTSSCAPRLLPSPIPRGGTGTRRGPRDGEV